MRIIRQRTNVPGDESGVAWQSSNPFPVIYFGGGWAETVSSLNVPGVNDGDTSAPQSHSTLPLVGSYLDESQDGMRLVLGFVCPPNRSVTAHIWLLVDDE